MSAVRDVVCYLCVRYPHKSELSNARVTKMVFLADWKAALDDRRQITPIRWRFHHYGPWTDDVITAARRGPGLEVIATQNHLGGPKELIVPGPAADWPSVGARDSDLLDHVVDTTEGLQWDDFIKLVYSTYPVLSQPRYSHLDLVDLAERYLKERAAL